MKIILTALVTVGLCIFALRSDVTPWRLVRATDLEQLRQAHVERQVVVAPRAPTIDHSGDWMRDPNYRSALEKTTIIGRREGAAPRDFNKPSPTPYRHP